MLLLLTFRKDGQKFNVSNAQNNRKNLNFLPTLPADPTSRSRV